MSLNLHTIKASPKKKKRRIGRGNASGRGTYSGRGIKGQRSRSGGKKGLKMKGFKQNLLRIPKLRGFKSPKPKKENINLSVLDINFRDQDIITPKILEEKGLIKKSSHGVKILSGGELTKKLTFEDCWYSKTAEEKIIKAGGKIKRQTDKKVVKKESFPAKATADKSDDKDKPIKK